MVLEPPRCRKDPRIVKLADGLKTLSDPSRLRILCFLREGEACVCDVEKHLGISQQLTSHHLHVLLDAGFLKLRKEGTRCNYSINVENLRAICEIFDEYVDWRKVKAGVQQSMSASPAHNRVPPHSQLTSGSRPSRQVRRSPPASRCTAVRGLYSSPNGSLGSCLRRSGE